MDASMIKTGFSNRLRTIVQPGVHDANAERQRHLVRLIALLAFCASVSLWPAVAERGREQLGLVVPVAAQAPVELDRSIRDYKLPSEIPWVVRNGSSSLTLYGDASKPGGIYVSLLRRPYDNWSAPHTHTSERYVAQGRFKIGVEWRL
jgi:hypothetical protein